MPWQKQFDSDDALAKAMSAFWARGYEATSIQDLLAVMGINRGSLYATFGDKHSLFMAALRRYDARYRADWIATLSQSASPRAAILGAFESAIATAIDQGSSDGCLLVNTALELSPHDPEVAALVAKSFQEMEGFFHAMITESQAKGEIPTAVEPVGTARALLSLFIGLRVLARSRPEAALLRSVAQQAEGLIS